MKMHVVVTDGAGVVFQGEMILTPAGKTPKSARRVANRGPESAEHQKRSESPELDFELPVRAFVKRYARGLSGPKRFTLLLARLTQGKVGQTVSAKDVEKQWNANKEPMGGRYNAAYQTRAKSEGWIDVPTRASVVLLKWWTNVLKESA